MSTATSAAKTPPTTFERLKAKYPHLAAEKLEGFAKRIDELELQQKEPVAWIVTGSGQLLVFRRPDQDEWEEAGARTKRDPMPVVNRQLALQTVLEPTADDMAAVFKRWPGLHARIGDALTVLVGADEELTVKKD